MIFFTLGVFFRSFFIYNAVFILFSLAVLGNFFVLVFLIRIVCFVWVEFGFRFFLNLSSGFVRFDLWRMFSVCAMERRI